MTSDKRAWGWTLGLASIGCGGLAILYATNLPQAALGFYAVALFLAVIVNAEVNR